jgi:hypothetical protein
VVLYQPFYFCQEDLQSFWIKGHNFGNIKLIITKFILDLCTVVKKIITYKFQMVFLRGNLVIKSVFFNKSRDITPKQNQDWVFAHCELLNAHHTIFLIQNIISGHHRFIFRRNHVNIYIYKSISFPHKDVLIYHDESSTVYHLFSGYSSFIHQ